MSALLRRGSFRSGLLVSMLANLGAKAISFLVNPTIARLFGARPETDIYFFCLGTITTLAIFLTSVNATVMIPYALHLETRERTSSYPFLSACMAGYGLIAIALCAVELIFPVGTLTLASGIAPAVLRQNAFLIRAFAPLLPLMTLTNALADILLGFRFFAIPVIVGGVASLATLLFLLAFSSRLGLASGAAGLAAAYCLNLVALLWIAYAKLGWRFTTLELPTDGRVWRDATAAFLGNCTSFATNCLPYLLLTHARSGALTAFMYAQTAAGLANSLILAQFSSVAGVRLNEVFASRDGKSGSELFVRLSRSLQFVLAPLGFLICALAQDIIVVLFGRQRLSSADLELATDMLRLLGILVPMAGVNTLCSRLFTAARQVEFSFGYQLSFSALLAAGCVVSFRLLGPVGYPAAVVAMYCANVFAVRWIFRPRFPDLRYGDVILHFLLMIAVSGMLSSVVYTALHLFSLSGINALLVGSALFAALFLIANVLWPLDREVVSLVHGLANAFKNRALGIWRPQSA